MNSNKFKMILGFLVLVGASAEASLVDGPSSGGGGFVVNCPASILEPATVELLDLYEGRNNLGLNMAGSSGDLIQDYFSSVQRTYARQGKT